MNRRKMRLLLREWNFNRGNSGMDSHVMDKFEGFSN